MSGSATASTIALSKTPPFAEASAIVYRRLPPICILPVACWVSLVIALADSNWAPVLAVMAPAACGPIQGYASGAAVAAGVRRIQNEWRTGSTPPDFLEFRAWVRRMVRISSWAQLSTWVLLCGGMTAFLASTSRAVPDHAILDITLLFVFLVSCCLLVQPLFHFPFSIRVGFAIPLRSAQAAERMRIDLWQLSPAPPAPWNGWDEWAAAGARASKGKQFAALVGSVVFALLPVGASFGLMVGLWRVAPLGTGMAAGFFNSVASLVLLWAGGRVAMILRDRWLVFLDSRTAVE